jgi:hypothetical protein
VPILKKPCFTIDYKSVGIFASKTGFTDVLRACALQKTVVGMYICMYAVTTKISMLHSYLHTYKLEKSTRFSGLYHSAQFPQVPITNFSRFFSIKNDSSDVLCVLLTNA